MDLFSKRLFSVCLFLFFQYTPQLIEHDTMRERTKAPTPHSDLAPRVKLVLNRTYQREILWLCIKVIRISRSAEWISVDRSIDQHRPCHTRPRKEVQPDNLLRSRSGDLRINREDR